MRLRGTLKGHSGWVTQIATTAANPDMILSASRGEQNKQVKLYSNTKGMFYVRCHR